MATTEQLAQAEAEFKLADDALNTARTAVLRAERQFNLAREAGPDVDPDRLAQVTRNLDTARSNFQAADAAYTVAQQNFETVFNAVDETAASPVDPGVVNAESAAASQQPTSVPLSQVNFDAQPQTDPGEIPGVTVSDRLQTDPGEVPSVTAYGSSYAQDTGGVPNRTLAEPAPVPVPPVEDDIEGGAVGFPEDTFAGDGYGFVYDEDGELVPGDSAEADRIRNTPADTEDAFAGNGYGFEYNEDGELVPADSVEAELVRSPAAQPDPFEVDGADLAVTDEDLFAQDNPIRAPTPPLNYSVAFEDGFDWVIVDNNTGSFVETGFASQEAAQTALNNLTNQGLGVDPPASQADVRRVDNATEDSQEAALAAAARERARVQAILANQQRQADAGDWRLKLRLAPGARYLYRGEDGQGVQTGILAPLAVTDGVIFPYTPTINTNYAARYSETDLPHSNYRGYFYNNSFVEGINIEAAFTAQDTTEANYLLAVIHFFRSVTKMFYGQDDTNRGAPPPMVFLQGFGAYQFSRHPCVVSNFRYTLPSDVDYIRADVSPIAGLNIQQRRSPGGVPPQSLPTNVFTGALARLSAAGVPKGAVNRAPPAETLGTNSPTYVPTKIDIAIDLLPMQSRQQVSQGFNMKDFASGALIKKGFW